MTESGRPALAEAPSIGPPRFVEVDLGEIGVGELGDL